MMRVRVIQDCQERFAGSAASITLPGEAGELVVLEHHAPLLCGLRMGTVQIDALELSVRGGIACVNYNAVTILLR